MPLSTWVRKWMIFQKFFDQAGLIGQNGQTGIHLIQQEGGWSLLPPTRNPSHQRYIDTDFAAHLETDISWASQAVCKGLTHVFFGPPAERPERRTEREAIAASYCMACPVVHPCRDSARLNREHGFWGCENDEQRAAAGYSPRSPSRRAVIQARDFARHQGLGPVDDDQPAHKNLL